MSSGGPYCVPAVNRLIILGDSLRALVLPVCTFKRLMLKSSVRLKMFIFGTVTIRWTDFE